MQRHRAEIPAQLDAAAEVVQFLLVLAVDGNGVGVESVDQAVAAGLDDVGAEQPRGAVEVAHVQVDQGVELVAAFVAKLQARGAVVVAFVLVAFVGQRIADVVVTMLVEGRDAG